MLTSEELETLRAGIPADPDRSLLLRTLQARAAPVLAAMPTIPPIKALLSRDGGFCPTDGAPLGFDPWSPERHRCTRCGQSFTGERHDGNWARAQHLWVAERSAELALLAAVTEDERAGARAVELLAGYEELYFALPNRDNVLGPSHLFFSTYLESLWLTSYLAAAFLLRESGRLPEERAEGINRVADEAASLIGDFNEGMSNRQTWHAAALTAIAAWFGDEELSRAAVEARTGLLGHLADGFGEDGLWWEGENYHLFALRGLMQGLSWARALGIDLLEDAELKSHFRAALLGPTRSALPDLSYPARRDSRYGASLAGPASRELWEVGRAWLGDDPELEAWLAALDGAVPPPPGDQYDAWLHDAGLPNPPTPGRGGLSWWALTVLAPRTDRAAEWQSGSVLLASQGLAVLREGTAYASLECGPDIGGHGHPDRLHLSVHAGGIHWLPDQGTGSYVHPSLAWYRSALAHNAPLLDGVNAGGEDAWCEAFEAGDGWSWCRGKAGPVRRTLILGGSHLVDVLEVEAEQERNVELPWHFQGELQVESKGVWEPATRDHPFVSGVERFRATTAEPLRVTARQGTASVRALFLAPDAELLRAVGPGLPTEPEPRPFLLQRGRGSTLRWISVLDFATEQPDSAMAGVEMDGDAVSVSTGQGVIRYHFAQSGLEIRSPGGLLVLGGLLPAPSRRAPVFSERGHRAEALAPRLADPPALDGTLAGFNGSAPLALDTELQYRRSEEPYDPERFSAQAWVNWDGEALYLAVAVAKPELMFRAADAAPLALDNEPEDINSDGLQVYLQFEDGAVGFLVIPEPGGELRVRGIEGGAPRVSGRWAPVAEGYLVTLRVDDARFALLHHGLRVGFDLLVNEMQPGRVRRAGQLAWSGGGGWVYLRGDRQDPSLFGQLELG